MIYLPAIASHILKTLVIAPLIAGFATKFVMASDKAICYLPSEKNVSYSSLGTLATGQPTISIPYGANPLQFGELWLPIETGDITETTNSKDIQRKQHPLVVLIHGGCWLNQYDLKHTYALSTALSASGYAVWAIEYRRTGDEGGGWPGTFEDIQKAIEFTQSLGDYPVDLSKIVLAGHSAGGHLALLAGSDRNLVNRAKISAVIGLAAITDIISYAEGKNDCQTATPKFMGGTPKSIPKLYEQANPMSKTLHPNSVLLQGTADTIVDPEFAERSGLKTQMIEGAGHFDMVHPSTASFQALLVLLAENFK